MTSKEALEEQSNWPEIVVVPQTMQESPEDDENVLKISSELTEHIELADQIVIRRRVPVEDPEEEMGSVNSNPVLTTIDETGPEIETRDIVQDAKFFQEVATEYQLAYQSLDEKYTHQAVLVKEASKALKASESHVVELREEVDAFKQTRESDIRQAVGQVVSQYKQHLSSVMCGCTPLTIRETETLTSNGLYI